MKITKEYIILFTLIICLSLYLVFSGINKTNYELPDLKKLDNDSITRVVLDKDGKSVVLLKKDGNWLVSEKGYKADKSAVREITWAISNLSLTTLITTEGDYKRYDLDSKKGIVVAAYAKDKLLRSFTIGKTASSYSHTFIKLADNKNVYHAKGNFRLDFNKKVDEFRDKLVFKIDENKLSKIDMKIGTRKISLSKTEKKEKKKTLTLWSLKGKTVKKEIVDDILSDIKSLKCSKFVYEPKENFKKPLYSIFFMGDKLNSLNMYKKGEDFVFTSSQSPYPFKVSSWTKDQLIKNMKKIAK